MDRIIQAGDIVKSLSGHDKNQLFLVLSIDKFGFLDIINGKSRKIEKPKKKNPKHVQFVATDKNLLNRLNSPTITNAELYKLINLYKNNEE